MTTLNDEQLTEVYNKANGIDGGKNPPITTERIFNAMRACLALSSQAAISGELMDEEIVSSLEAQNVRLDALRKRLGMPLTGEVEALKDELASALVDLEREVQVGNEYFIRANKAEKERDALQLQLSQRQEGLIGATVTLDRDMHDGYLERYFGKVTHLVGSMICANYTAVCSGIPIEEMTPDAAPSAPEANRRNPPLPGGSACKVCEGVCVGHVSGGPLEDGKQ